MGSRGRKRRGALNAKDGITASSPMEADGHLVAEVHGLDPMEAPPKFNYWAEKIRATGPGQALRFNNMARREAIVGALARTGRVHVAARVGGISRKSLYTWLKRGEDQCGAMVQADMKDEEYEGSTSHVEFYLACQRALGWREASWQQVIQNAADTDPRWAAWLLDRIAGVGREDLDQGLEIEVTDREGAVTRVKAKLQDIAARRSMSVEPDLDEPG